MSCFPWSPQPRVPGPSFQYVTFPLPALAFLPQPPHQCPFLSGLGTGASVLHVCGCFPQGQEAAGTQDGLSFQGLGSQGTTSGRECKGGRAQHLPLSLRARWLLGIPRVAGLSQEGGKQLKVKSQGQEQKCLPRSNIPLRVWRLYQAPLCSPCFSEKEAEASFSAFLREVLKWPMPFQLVGRSNRLSVWRVGCWAGLALAPNSLQLSLRGTGLCMAGGHWNHQVEVSHCRRGQRDATRRLQSSALAQEDPGQWSWATCPSPFASFLPTSESEGTDASLKVHFLSSEHQDPLWALQILQRIIRPLVRS